jgi:hypothetical protein
MSTETNTVQPMIYAAMAAVMSDIGTVGKSGVNKEQHYKFRSIEDVMSAVRAGLTKHGVFYLPTVLNRIPETRQTGGGKPMNVVHLEIRYDFYAADGSSVSSVVWGEGADMADKATNKAMSQALKYNLVQAFSIAAEDMQDADRSAVEAGPDRGYRSAGESFENAAPARQRAADQPPAPDSAWLTEHLPRIQEFPTEEAGRELWRKVAAAAKDRDISRAEAKRLQDLITARITELRVAQQGGGDPLSVYGLAPEDDWATKVASIADQDDADAAAADVVKQVGSGSMSAEHSVAVNAAIDARMAELNAKAAA